MSKVKWFLIVLLAVGCLLAGNGLWNTNLPPLSNSAHKIVHVSFDDVVSVFKDLKKDSLSYVSIFEHAFLKELKNLHDEYGACFSLYVFERDGDFHISEVPVRFREEFRENADWLKLKEFTESYHTVNEAITIWGGGLLPVSGYPSPLFLWGGFSCWSY